MIYFAVSRALAGNSFPRNVSIKAAALKLHKAAGTRSPDQSRDIQQKYVIIVIS